MSQHRHWCRNVLLDIIQCSNCKDAVRIRWVGRLGGFKRIWHVYCRLGSCFLFIFIWRVVEKLISDYKESPHHWRSKEINMLRWVCCDGCQPSKQIVIEEFCCTCNSFTVGMAAESGGTDFRDSSHSTSARWFLLSSSFINLHSSYSSVSCKNHAKAVQRFCWIWWGDCLLFFFKNLLEWMGLVYSITTTIVIMIFSKIDLGTNKHTCTRAYLVSLNDQGIPPCTVETNFRISSVDLGTHRGFEVNSQVPNWEAKLWTVQQVPFGVSIQMIWSLIWWWFRSYLHCGKCKELWHRLRHPKIRGLEKDFLFKLGESFVSMVAFGRVCVVVKHQIRHHQFSIFCFVMIELMSVFMGSDLPMWTGAVALFHIFER